MPANDDRIGAQSSFEQAPGAQNAVPPPPMSRDKRGWNVAPEADPVRKVSIIPRGQALGVTLATPDGDRVSYSRDELVARIKGALGGRISEEVVYGVITTGAESDIQQLTGIARQMVGRWGMSEKLGPVAVLHSDEPGSFLPAAAETSPRTQWIVDKEVQRLITDVHTQVTQLLSDHRSQLDSLAQALLKAETLDAADAYTAALIRVDPSGDRVVSTN
jgi:cell division protease FtsH